MTELVDHMPWLAVAGGSRCSGVVECPSPAACFAREWV
jgi:hypothetical protein